MLCFFKEGIIVAEKTAIIAISKIKFITLKPLKLVLI